ncbi:receptor-like protein 2 [Dorcoceras hygrometricum]|uniref:Receptor-like protein 2 n=1 Tax=Dorcoceras hygrometricum TaxID=472368 RepID=A0A2Z7ACM0_9LAMI|nr:receptor-like protein 2 [Dorcoceras hygrometricum]
MADTDSLETAVRMWEYIIAKYREMLLRKFLETHRTNIRSGQPTTAIDIQIIALLSDAHLFALETLQTQMRIHGLKWERMCSSSLFEGESRDREGGDFWKRLPKPVVSLEWDIPPQRQFVDTLATVSDLFKIIRKRWADFFSAPSGYTLTSLSISTDSRMLFTTDDIPLGDETADDQILMPTTDIPATDFTESFAQLRASVTQLSINQLRTKDIIGDLKNKLLSKIDNLEKASTEAHTQKDQVFRDLADIRKVVKEQKDALSQHMDDKLKGIKDQQAALSHDLMEFRVQAQTLIPSPLNCLNLLIISIEVVMPKRGKVVATEVRSLLLMIVADLVLVMEEEDPVEVVGADFRVKDTIEVVDLTKDQEEALDTS